MAVRLAQRPRRVIAMAAAGLLAAAMSGCASAPLYPDIPAAGNATLTVAPTSAFQFQIMPDGDRCGGYWQLRPDQDPLQRADRTLVIPAGNKIAVQLIWVVPGAAACHVIVAFEPVAGGRYVLDSRLSQDKCHVDVRPLDTASADGLKVQQMEWFGLKVPSECRPVATPAAD